MLSVPGRADTSEGETEGWVSGIILDCKEVLKKSGMVDKNFVSHSCPYEGFFMRGAFSWPLKQTMIKNLY